MNDQYINHIVKFKDKDEAKAMKFLQAAVSKDAARAVLQTFHVKNGRTESTDGFRNHVINTPESLQEHEGKNMKPDSAIAVNPRPEEFCEYPGNFPDTQFLRDKYANEEIVIQFGIDKKFLKDLINMPTSHEGLVIFSVIDDMSPIRVTTTEEEFQAEAYIMPKYLGDKKK